MAELKKYNGMENVLADINSQFISLPEDAVKLHNRILKSVLETFVEKFKEKDEMFKAMYSRVFYGGGYYDGLKVGEPVEFDLDLLLTVPKFAEPDLANANVPGFVNLKLKKFEAFMKQPEAKAYRNFGKLFDDDKYLSTQKVLAWFEGVVQKALNDFPGGGSKRILQNAEGLFEISVCKGGPAMTLKISNTRVKMDVDLVICFIFGNNEWPTGKFKPNPVPTKPSFFIVPKKPKHVEGKEGPRLWRLSFQEQERVLMDNKRTLKPTIKLLKKLRDNLQHCCIASYYIKTVVLHIADTKNEDFWKNSLSYVFMTILSEYQKYIESEKIPYYWNKNYNLLASLNPDKRSLMLQNISNRLKVIISDIEKNLSEPTTIAKYLLSSKEFADFKLKALKLN